MLLFVQKRAQISPGLNCGKPRTGLHYQKTRSNCAAGDRTRTSSDFSPVEKVVSKAAADTCQRSNERSPCPSLPRLRHSLTQISDPDMRHLFQPDRREFKFRLFAQRSSNDTVSVINDCGESSGYAVVPTQRSSPHEQARRQMFSAWEASGGGRRPDLAPRVGETAALCFILPGLMPRRPGSSGQQSEIWQVFHGNGGPCMQICTLRPTAPASAARPGAKALPDPWGGGAGGVRDFLNVEGRVRP